MRRRTGYAGHLVATTISMLGSRVTMVALPWLVLETTGSPGRTGLVAFAEMLPYVLACALGGPLIDRVGGRRVSILADVASAVAIGAIPLLYDSGRLTFGALTAVVAVAGMLRGLGDTAKRGAMFPQVVTEAGVEMTRATALVDGTNRAAGLIGAPLAGLLIVWLGTANVLLVDAASFGLCALLIGLAVRVPGRATDPGEPERYHQALRAGIRFVRRDKLVLGLMLMVFATNLLDQAYGAVLVPLWARNSFGSPVGIGIVSASFGLGAVVGNAVYAVLATRLPRWAPYAIGFLIAGAPRYLVLAVDSPVWLIAANGVLAGLATGAVNPILGAVLYERIPERLQARVQGIATALAFAGMPLGGLLGGWLGEYGVRISLLVAGGAYLIATLAPFVGRTWRAMDRPVSTQDTTAASGTRVRCASGSATNTLAKVTSGSLSTNDRAPAAGTASRH